MQKKVLFLIPSFEYGGAELLVMQQINWLQANGWDIYLAIVSNKYNNDFLKLVCLRSEHFLFLDSKHSVLNATAIKHAIMHKGKLVKFARSNKIDKIIASLPLAHFWGRLVKLKISSIDLIVYHHSMQYQASPLDTVFKKAFNQLQKILALKTDNRSVCISEAVKKNIQENFFLSNPVVLYNAVPKKDIAASRKNHFGPDRSKVAILLPGRLHPAKGHLFFLTVFKQLLQETGQPLHLTIAGGGPLENEIRQFLDDHTMNSSVSVTGFLSNEILLQEMAKADLIIIPSLSEGLGNVGIEALMLGKTVVASDAGGLKEVFTHGKNGYVFEAGIHNSCLNVLRSVVSNLPSSLLPGKALKEDYKNRFSFEAHIKKFAQLLTAT